MLTRLTTGTLVYRAALAKVIAQSVWFWAMPVPSTTSTIEPAQSLPVTVAEVRWALSVPEPGLAVPGKPLLGASPVGSGSGRPDPVDSGSIHDGLVMDFWRST